MRTEATPRAMRWRSPSVGIGSRLVPHETGIALLVVAADALRAEFELAEYARENRRRRRRRCARLRKG